MKGNKILVAYASKYGSTKEVAEKIAETMSELDYQVETMKMKEVKNIEGYDALVLGTALYINKLHKDSKNFLKKNQEMIMGSPVAMFVLGPVKDPINDEEWQNSQKQLDKEMEQFDWFKPVDLKLVGGKFDPDTLGFPMNKFAKSEPATDIRDWNEIKKWAEKVAKMFRLG